jgi:hypothetical protein
VRDNNFFYFFRQQALMTGVKNLSGFNITFLHLTGSTAGLVWKAPPALQNPSEHQQHGISTNSLHMPK